MPTTVSVIIAAKDSADTIVKAIQSALVQPEVIQLIVVDDGSRDATAEVARAACDGSGRVEVISLDRNYGPAHARNRALEVCRGQLAAILDADDFLLPGRFTRLLPHNDWDMIADNIAFVPTGYEGALNAVGVDDARPLSLEAFVLGNLTRDDRHRGELGFLKPVIRLAFLKAHNLSYNEGLRLGEDYDLYARMLAAGARFKTTRTLGYGAVVRPNSLSGQHRTEDLRRLADADHDLLALPLSAPERHAIHQHEIQTRNRYRHRHYLDLKRDKGAAATLKALLADPASWAPVVKGVLRDKLSPPPAPSASGDVRYLFPLPEA
ncbi:glycosyltransferase family 2 protein [Asticcacaulis machinosus]|uniref:Glycosyltransferase n=1 Tax=Asticcacaulis machinosus TaxID=2984211 RepID=A0ABT5HJV0_9CAUL|nr:glycosyltransferase [Asticcacaulis machinosus]MDC7676436.1 glycosyltransferase [Asticcacaulis machinosus]